MIILDAHNALRPPGPNNPVRTPVDAPDRTCLDAIHIIREDGDFFILETLQPLDRSQPKSVCFIHVQVSSLVTQLFDELDLVVFPPEKSLGSADPDIAFPVCLKSKYIVSAQTFLHAVMRNLLLMQAEQSCGFCPDP